MLNKKTKQNAAAVQDAVKKIGVIEYLFFTNFPYEKETLMTTY